MQRSTLRSDKYRLKIVSLLGIVSVGASICSPMRTDAAPKTTFACISQNGDFVTVARRGDRQTSPMIIWKDKSWGTYTPKKRCDIVSKRLTKAVSSTGKLNTLDLSFGEIKSIPVICYITKKDEKCSSKNILFSLKSSDRGQEQEIISTLLNFSKLGSGSGTARGVLNESVTAPQTWGESVDKAFTEPNDSNREDGL